MPVSALSRLVLPWSMCPAVPMTTLRRASAAVGSGIAGQRRPDRRRQGRVVGRARPSAGRAAPPRARPARRRPASRHGGGRAAVRPGGSTAHTARDGSTSPGREPPPTVASTAATLCAALRPSRRSPRPASASSSTGAEIWRQTGMSRVATPARYSASVAATAARTTLSGRIARASGSLRRRATRSARPTMNPAWGPPTSLSPLNVTRSAPSASRSLGIGSWASPNAAVSSSAPLPRSSTTSAPSRCAAAARAGASGASTNPAWLKFDGWTRSTSRARPSSRAASKSATRVRFVVPTSTSFAPARRTISGIRTPPPISTSSPRLTATPPRPASPTASATAAALLVTISASSAPVSATRCASASR